MQKSDYKKIKELISSSKKIVITTHRSPDGDAIGSSLGLYRVLREQGFDVSVVVPNEFPDFLKWMNGSNTILNYSKDEDKINSLFQQADLVFCLDYNSIHRVGNVQQLLEKYNGKSVMIDHHPQPDDYATYLLSDTSLSSTAELVYDFIIELDWENLIDEQVASCLYSGIVTDTGSFRFSSTSAKTHRVVAGLMEKGLKPHLVHQAIYDSNTENRLKLLGYCLSEKMKVLPEYSTAYIWLSNEELNRFNYQSGDTEGVVNYALSIKGINFAAIIKQNEENIRMSFRSKGNFSVNKFARENFNGGGHLNAAGGMSEDTLQNTINKFESLLPKYKAELNA